MRFQVPSLAMPQASRLIAGLWPAGLLAGVGRRVQRVRHALAAAREPEALPTAPRLEPRVEPPPAEADAPVQSQFIARADWADRLWDAGFVGPGGAAEALRLSSLLPLSPATTLLLVGQDSGGAAAAIAGSRGTWIACHQHDPLNVSYMTSRLQAFGKRIAVQPWDPTKPGFRANYHHHALGLEPLLTHPRPEPFCQAVAGAVKSGGQFVMVELVLPGPGGTGPSFDRWLELERRRGPPPTRAQLESAIQKAGFQIHVAEDSSARHCAGIVEGFGRLVQGLRSNRPGNVDSVNALLTEAEAWLLRHRLLTAGKLVLVRWHASRRTSVR